MADEDNSKSIAIAFQFGLAMGFAKKYDECDDCISRQEVVDYLCVHCPDDAECHKDCDDIKNIKSFPPVTPQPKPAYWIPIVVRGQNSYCCSNCFSECCYEPTAFCPDCGRKMVEREDKNVRI